MCLDAARGAGDRGEVPVGALIARRWRGGGRWRECVDRLNRPIRPPTPRSWRCANACSEPRQLSTERSGALRYHGALLDVRRSHSCRREWCESSTDVRRRQGGVSRQPVGDYSSRSAPEPPFRGSRRCARRGSGGAAARLLSRSPRLESLFGPGKLGREAGDASSACRPALSSSAFAKLMIGGRLVCGRGPRYNSQPFGEVGESG